MLDVGGRLDAAIGFLSDFPFLLTSIRLAEGFKALTKSLAFEDRHCGIAMVPEYARRRRFSIKLESLIFLASLKANVCNRLVWTTRN